MPNSLRLISFYILILASLCGAPANASNEFSAEYSKKVDRLFEDAVDHGHLVGASVFIADSTGHVFKKHYGQRSVEKNILANDHTLYEIGSVSKTFTRLLLAQQPDLSLQTPLSSLLPAGVKNPEPAGKPLRIQDLAFHTGFLAAVPCLTQSDQTLKCYNYDTYSDDPYSNMTRASLLEFVNGYADWIKLFSPSDVPRPGVYYRYSNVGMGLLGELLATRKGFDSYRSLLKTSVLEPIGMMETDTDLTCEKTGTCPNLADVYLRKGAAWQTGSRWHLPAINGAGGIRSSLSDMSKYLKAEMGLTPTLSIQAAIARSQTRLPNVEKDLESLACKLGQTPEKDGCNSVSSQYAYLGWPAFANRQVFYHAGETGHSQAMIAFTKDHDIGVVILSNSKPADGGHLPNFAALCALQLAGHNLGDDWCTYYASKYQK